MPVNIGSAYSWERKAIKQCYVVCRENEAKRRKFGVNITNLANQKPYIQPAQVKNGCKQCNVPLCKRKGCFEAFHNVNSQI